MAPGPNPPHRRGIMPDGADAARIMVSIQMLVDLVIIALVVRLPVNTAKTSLLRAGQSPAD